MTSNKHNTMFLKRERVETYALYDVPWKLLSILTVLCSHFRNTAFVFKESVAEAQLLKAHCMKASLSFCFYYLTLTVNVFSSGAAIPPVIMDALEKRAFLKVGPLVRADCFDSCRHAVCVRPRWPCHIPNVE